VYFPVLIVLDEKPEPGRLYKTIENHILPHADVKFDFFQVEDAHNQELPVFPVDQLTPETIARVDAVYVAGHGWFDGREYQPWQPFPNIWQSKPLPPAEWLKEQPEHFACIVNCHN
jgi:hypothetical protein